MPKWVLLLAVGLSLPACEPDQGPAADTSGEIGDLDFEELVRLDFSDAPTLPSDQGLVAWDRTRGIVAFVDCQVPYEIILVLPILHG